MNFLLVAVLAWSGTILASTDFFSSTQHISITRNNDTGWQQELQGKYDFNRKLSGGLGGSYLQRFSFYEKRFGGFVGYRFTDRLSVEARMYFGEEGNHILPRRQGILTAYYSLGCGWTPYLVYRDYRYSSTHVNMVNLGLEIETIPHFIFVPQVMIGNATFSGPATTEAVNSYGLRVMYYEEKKYTAFIYGARGKEAAQGIVGASNILVDTRTAGLGGSYFITEGLRAELVFDHTDYEQLKTQFLTTTLNLFWTVI
ncbi:MAG: hypothetical protein ACJ76H_16390 [Bacteriovoracaceae bacterium]